MTAIVGYWFFVPSLTGRINRAFFPTVTEAAQRARINGAQKIYYRDELGTDVFVTDVKERP